MIITKANITEKTVESWKLSVTKLSVTKLSITLADVSSRISFTFMKKRFLYCLGNFSLCYLNISVLQWHMIYISYQNKIQLYQLPKFSWTEKNLGVNLRILSASLLFGRILYRNVCVLKLTYVTQNAHVKQSRIDNCIAVELSIV